MMKVYDVKVCCMDCGKSFEERKRDKFDDYTMIFYDCKRCNSQIYLVLNHYED